MMTVCAGRDDEQAAEISKAMPSEHFATIVLDFQLS
jgi:hypothetical protein